MQNFTNEELISYIYNEINANRKAELEKELQTNWALKEKLRVFTEAKNRISKMRLFAPTKKTVDLVLQYANKSSEVLSR